MNPWPVYSFMKMSWMRRDHIPTRKEIDMAFPDMTEEEKEEGMIEFKLAYDRVFSKEPWHQEKHIPTWFLDYIEELLKKGA